MGGERGEDHGGDDVREAQAIMKIAVAHTSRSSSLAAVEAGMHAGLGEHGRPSEVGVLSAAGAGRTAVRSAPRLNDKAVAELHPLRGQVWDSDALRRPPRRWWSLRLGGARRRCPLSSDKDRIS